MVTIGQTLGEARREAGLSVEAIAHDTKIHSTMIRAIENDDFSMFPSVAYARSFIGKYAGVLGIDLSDSLKALNSGVTLQLSDHELMGEMKNTIKKDSRFRREKTPRALRKPKTRKSRSPLLLNLILIILIGAMGLFYFLGFHAQTPEEAQEKITNGILGANPFRSEENEISKHPLATGTKFVNPDAPSSPGNSHAVSEGGIEKPDVELNLDEPRPQPGESVARAEMPALPPRETPSVSADPALPSGPIGTSDIPALQSVEEEPTAVLRPEGTDPVEDEAPAEEPDEPLRAIPVVGNR